MAEIAIRLFDEVVIVIKLEMFVEPLIGTVIPSFYFTVMSRILRLDTLMLNL